MGRYRVIKAYGPWSVGHIFTDMAGNVGRTLMKRGLIVEDKKIEAPLAKAMPSPVNRMMKVPVRKESR